MYPHPVPTIRGWGRGHTGNIIVLEGGTKPESDVTGGRDSYSRGLSPAAALAPSSKQQGQEDTQGRHHPTHSPTQHQHLCPLPTPAFVSPIFHNSFIPRFLRCFAGLPPHAQAPCPRTWALPAPAAGPTLSAESPVTGWPCSPGSARSSHSPSCWWPWGPSHSGPAGGWGQGRGQFLSPLGQQLPLTSRNPSCS